MKTEKGQGLVEYALILTLVAIVVIGIPLCCLLVFMPFIWPWLRDTAYPWLVGVVAGTMNGDPASIVLAIIVALVFLFIASRFRRR